MAEDAARRSAQAGERIERLKRGEQIANGKALDLAAILREAGWTAAELDHARLLASLPADAIPAIGKEAQKATKRAERTIVRRMARQNSP
jgi:hypothetical protein